MHTVPIAQDLADDVVEAAARIAFGRRQEFIVEAEAVEEMPQHRIVVVREALVGPERVGDLRQRLAEMRGEHLLLGHVVRHLAQPVHVVAEGDQPRRRAAGQFLISLPDEGRAQHFVEGADVRQARGTVAGLEDHRLAVGLPSGQRFSSLRASS